jgi:hypothetical protein
MNYFAGIKSSESLALMVQLDVPDCCTEPIEEMSERVEYLFANSISLYFLSFSQFPVSLLVQLELLCWL